MEIYGDEILRLALDSSVAISGMLRDRRLENRKRGRGKNLGTAASPESGKEWIVCNFPPLPSRIHYFSTRK